jgi:hypothetical protein
MVRFFRNMFLFVGFVVFALVVAVAGGTPASATGNSHCPDHNGQA